MPGMTGLELLPRVKTMMPGLPVVMITAYGDAATLRRAKEAGADDIYGKPIDFAALKAEIDQRLAAHGLPAQRLANCNGSAWRSAAQKRSRRMSASENS